MAMDKMMTGENQAISIETFIEKLNKFLFWTWQTIWIVGRNDRRKFIHALKVGLSLTLVSLLYLMEPLFKGIGENTIWAMMTVVVVLEFTAGATLCKGLNRVLGTFLAGLFAFVIECISDESSGVFHGTFIGAAVFVIGTVSAYIRFIPYIKSNYDYGVLVFLLTFNLITVSSYRVDNVMKMAHERFYTIAIGCGVCLVMSLLVFPCWSGEQLHCSIVSKIEGLAKATQASVSEYFDDNTEETKEESSKNHICKCYRTVLDSKSNEEALAVHASWEPRYLRNCKSPWQQYVKLGSALRHFGYTVVAMHGCLQSEIQTTRTIRALFKDPCTRLATEISKALIKMAESIRNRHQCSQEEISDLLQEALEDLNTALKSQPKLFLNPNISFSQENSAKDCGIGKKAVDQLAQKVLRRSLSKIAITSLEFSEALPFAAFASLLVEAVARLDLVIEHVEELGRIASFKEFDNEHEFASFGRDRKGNLRDLECHMPSQGAE